MKKLKMDKIIVEIKKTVRQKWFLKYVLLLSITVIAVSAFIPMGFFYYILYTYTDYRILSENEPFTDFPEVWSFSKGFLISTVRENYIFPDDPLEYHVSVSNPKNEDRKLTAFLKIYKGGERLGDVFEKDWWIKPNQALKTELPIFLSEEGNYRLEIRYVFDRQIPGSVHPNHTFRIENIQVQSLSDKLLAESNNANFWSYMSIFGVAIAGNTASILYLRKQHRQTEIQLSLTRKELESRLRAELEISVGESNLKKIDDKNWEGFVKIVIRNNGTISARNVNVHFQDPTFAFTLPQLVHEEKNIKKTSFPIPGSIPSHVHYPEHIPHKTQLDKSGVYELAIWVSYDYADVKNAELIQIIKINAQTNTDGPLYEKEDIDEERKKLKENGLIS